MLDPIWRAGFARLAPLDLTFEAGLYHPELVDLARAYPQITDSSRLFAVRKSGAVQRHRKSASIV